VDYDEATIRSALDRLGRRKWTTLASWNTARSVKYKHLLDKALELGPGELSLLTVLMLRGPQTPGELRPRTERMYGFESNDELDEALRTLVERGLVTALPRRPGERGQRYTHLLEGDGATEGAEPPPARVAEEAPAPAPARGDALPERVERLEAEVAAMRDELRALREDLGA
jgi:uncharacterized protein YceH (UPF0502 family)